MEDEILDEEVDSSATEDETEDSSTSEEDQHSEATEDKAVDQPPFHEHPRWKEVQDEKERAREEAARAKAEAEYYRGLAEGNKPPADDPYKDMDQQTRDFYKNLDTRVSGMVSKEVQKAREEARKEYQSEISALQQEYGKIAANQFLKDNPDIKAGSPELEKIITYSRKHNLPLSDAKKIVYYDIDVNKAAEKVKQKQVKKAQEKAKANVERETSPPPKVAPTRKSMEITLDDLEDTAKELGVSF